MSKLRQGGGVGASALVFSVAFGLWMAGPARPGSVPEQTGPALTVVAQEGGALKALASTHDTLYAAVGPRIVARDSEFAPVAAGELLPAVPHALTASGDRLLAAVGDELFVYDVSAPNTLPPAAVLPTGRVSALALDGTVGYAAVAGRLLTIDLRKAALPLVMGNRALDASVSALAAWGGLVAAAGPRGYIFVDATDPYTPREVGLFTATPEPYGARLLLAGRFLLAADPTTGLRVIDVSNPRLPRQTGATTDPALDVAADGDTVFGFTLGSGSDTVVTAYDAHQLPQLVPQASMQVAGLQSSPVVLHERLFTVAEDVGALALALPLPGRVEASWNAAPDSRVAAAGAWIWVVSGTGAHQREVRLVNGASTRAVGSVPASGTGEDIVADASHAFVANGEGGLDVVSAAPEGPVFTGHLDTPGSAHGLAVSDQTVFVADGPTGLTLVSVADPSRPTVLASLAFPTAAVDVAVLGTTAFVAAGTGGLHIVDVATPAAPRLLGSLAASSAYPGPGMTNFHLVAASPGRAYAAMPNGTVSVIDVTDPAAPREVSVHATGGRSADMDLAGMRLLLAAYFDGLVVLDPGAPVAKLALPGWALGARAFGQLVVVAGDDAGLLVLGAPSSPRPTATRTPLPTPTRTPTVAGRPAHRVWLPLATTHR